MSRPVPRSRRCLSTHLTPALALTAALLAAVGGAACSDDGDDAVDPTTTQPTTTLTQAQQDEQALRQLTEDWYAQINEIFEERADPQTADEYITDDYYDAVISEVEAFRETGRTTERSAASRHVVESITVSGDAATLEECFVDADVLYDGDGQVLNDDIVTTRFTTVASMTEDGWRFERRVPRGEDEEGDQCPK